MSAAYIVKAPVDANYNIFFVLWRSDAVEQSVTVNVVVMGSISIWETIVFILVYFLFRLSAKIRGVKFLHSYTLSLCLYCYKASIQNSAESGERKCLNRNGVSYLTLGSQISAKLAFPSILSKKTQTICIFPFRASTGRSWYGVATRDLEQCSRNSRPFARRASVVMQAFEEM